MPDQIELFYDKEGIEICGATYVPGFISVEEEAELVSEMERGTWTYEFTRRRQHYGIAYGEKNWINPEPFPPWIEQIARRIVSLGLFSRQ